MTLVVNFPAIVPERPLEASDRVACQAFAMCDRAAVGAYVHPALHVVLSCQRCADRLGEQLDACSVEYE